MSTEVSLLEGLRTTANSTNTMVSREDQTLEHANEVVQRKPQRKWQSYIWDTLDSEYDAGR